MLGASLKDVGRWESRKDVGRVNFRKIFLKIIQTQTYCTLRGTFFSHLFKKTSETPRKDVVAARMNLQAQKNKNQDY